MSCWFKLVSIFVQRWNTLYTIHSLILVLSIQLQLLKYTTQFNVLHFFVVVGSRREKFYFVIHGPEGDLLMSWVHFGFVLFLQLHSFVFQDQLCTQVKMLHMSSLTTVLFSFVFEDQKEHSKVIEHTNSTKNIRTSCESCQGNHLWIHTGLHCLLKSLSYLFFSFSYCQFWCLCVCMYVCMYVWN
jgi:hypothetical protein